MSQSNSVNRQLVLASRPHGAPTADNFRLEQHPIPEAAEGELLLRTVYLSLDPYMRGRMSDAPSYAAPVEIGEVMTGGAVSKVVTSRHPDFQEGDWVLGTTGWQDYSVMPGDKVQKLADHIADHPSLALGVLGMPGFTAYMGLLDIGNPQPGETVVVAAATGPVGSMVGQIAKLKGCRAIGIAGGEEKCRYALEQFGFDACIDHRADDFEAQLAAACPDGIDVYYENVGGKVFDAVMPLLNSKARIPVCGVVAHYNATGLPDGPDRLPQLTGLILRKRLRMQGFIIFDDYGHRYPEFAAQMGEWFNAGKINFREDITDGLENAPQALIGLLEGKNFGKVVVRVGDDA
ncbi:NADP-dependent oxidoreductase [Chimaeribacter arupi]|uniref:NADP-dependent oxidoreductase n=2 Tax=Yersiniaceae TaxID=1903411 RepID=A0A2N5EMB4_9GAMM|nr:MULTISPECIES: NADP-dependent oxidoreductase [Yersiniaceae]MBS0969580.1 NADP-dependent oxidoreductase [Nissabacter archeti]MDV5142319.1 NADP-dependent oxidoreductase [Chimaeribacter arupi]PLR35266.1 NADP-dependent oxidoreductase [Chimaeribacter arupi]PLR44062.1 NADP-dependent oxidoreductase [Chimaeribacter arupi]PLR48473.1 NADP-dependent oxidoreductase [Chimaeribacter arupi]